MSRGRKFAQIEARRVLDDLQPGQVLPRVPTAPLPAGVLPDPWDVCDCDYETPVVDGKRVPHRLDPAWQWTEEPTRNGQLSQRALRPQVQLLLWGNERRGIEPCYPITGFHSGDPRYDPPGMTDLLLWPIGFPSVARELKRMGRSPELHQAITMTAMSRAGCDVGIWRTCCLLSGHISRQLSTWAGVPLHPNDPYARLGPAQPLTGLAAVEAAHRAGIKPARTARGTKPVLADIATDTAYVLDSLEGEPATGYVISPAGTVDEDTAINLALLRTWAVTAGVQPVELMWPWRLVVTDASYHLQLRAGAKTRWHQISRHPHLHPEIEVLTESMSSRTVTVRGVERCKKALTTARQPEGARP